MATIKIIPPTEVPTNAAQLIDVRTPAEFAQAHARGARNIPIEKLDPAALPKDQPIYLLCKAGSRAAKAANQLHAAGFTDISIVAGGIDAWIAANLPVDRSPTKTISLERQVRIAAGSLILLFLTLAATIHPLFALGAAFIGAGLTFAGITNTCGMAMLLTKCPWNN